jgi:hypothetical protein
VLKELVLRRRKLRGKEKIEETEEVEEFGSARSGPSFILSFIHSILDSFKKGRNRESRGHRGIRVGLDFIYSFLHFSIYSFIHRSRSEGGSILSFTHSLLHSLKWEEIEEIGLSDFGFRNSSLLKISQALKAILDSGFRTVSAEAIAKADFHSPILSFYHSLIESFTHSRREEIEKAEEIEEIVWAGISFTHFFISPFTHSKKKAQAPQPGLEKTNLMKKTLFYSVVY